MGLWGLWAWWLGWAWWAAEAGALCVGLAGLGLAVGLGGWWLGPVLRRLALLSQVGLLAKDLRLARPGPPRLAALRRLAGWLRPSEPCWTRVLEDLAWHTRFPDGLVASLFDCLLEGGSGAAQFLLALLASPYFDVSKAYHGRMSGAAREELFSEAFLAHLRIFFLFSDDATFQKAFVRLFHLAAKSLWFLKWRSTGDQGPEAKLTREQFRRHQGFLRDRDILGKVRGLLRRDLAGWLEDLDKVYAELAMGDNELQLPDGFHLSRPDFGLQYLLRPLLPGLARRWDELSASSKERLSGLRLLLCSGETAEEAVDAVELCAVPLLEDAHRLPLVCRRWLLGPIDVDEPVHWATPPPPTDLPADAQGYDWSSSPGRGLCCALVRALGEAVEAGGVSLAQAWRLLAPHSPRGPDLHMGTPFVVRALDVRREGPGGSDFRLAVFQVFRALPLRAETRLAGALVLRSLLLVEDGQEGNFRLAWAGAFAELKRLLLLLQPPYGWEGYRRFYPPWPPAHGYHHFNEVMDECLLRGRSLLVLPSEERRRTELLMAWRMQGLEPVLRPLAQQPQQPLLIPFTALQANSQALLNLATVLGHDQPDLRNTHIPKLPAINGLPTGTHAPATTDFHFPEY